MSTDALDSYITEVTNQLNDLNAEVKALDRAHKLDPDVRTLLYTARDTLRLQTRALRELRRRLTTVEAQAREWR
jgi:hypothetical protein